jgi:antitoxin FitA
MEEGEGGKRWSMTSPFAIIHASIAEEPMAQVVIRNLEDGVIDTLKERARRKGHSLEQELRDIVSEAAKLTVAEKLAIIDRIRGMTPPGDHPLVEDLIREDRDRR